MQELSKLIKSLEEKIPMMDAANTQISSAKVGWHVQHSLLVINSIINGLKQSDPTMYQWKFNLNKTLIFTLGKIPRGKGKAPKAVVPTDVQTSEQLREDLQTVRLMLLELEHFDAKSNFMHPYFGQLNLKQTKKFLALHTKHHLKIIDDILKG